MPDPDDAVRVQPVDRFVEHQGRGVAEQRPGDPEPLPHSQAELARGSVGDVGQAAHLEHFVDP